MRPRRSGALSVECKAIYLYLLTSGFKTEDLFGILFSTPTARAAYHALAAAIVRLSMKGILSGVATKPIEDIDCVRLFIETYSIRGNMKLFDDFRKE